MNGWPLVIIKIVSKYLTAKKRAQKYALLHKRFKVPEEQE
jgi:hypothetical protein